MSQDADDTILHQSETEDAVTEHLEGVGQVGHDAAHIANANVAHALNSTFSDTEGEAALNALGTKINAILAILQANGLMAAS